MRNPFGGDPLRVVGEVAGIRSLRLEHAQPAAAGDEHAADRDVFRKADPQVPRARGPAQAEADAVEGFGVVAVGQDDRSRAVFGLLSRDGCLLAVDPLGKRGRVEQLCIDGAVGCGGFRRGLGRDRGREKD